MGFLRTAREKKENILYGILTIVFLERVRIQCNRIKDYGEKNNFTDVQINTKINKSILKAGLLYSLVLLLPVSNYISDSIQHLFSNMEVAFFNTFLFPAIILIASEVFLVFVIRKLLKLYIEKMNKALGFFKKIGRRLWDGSVIVAQAPVKAGGAVKDKVVEGAKISTQVVSTVAHKSKRAIMPVISVIGAGLKKGVLKSTSVIKDKIENRKTKNGKNI